MIIILDTSTILSYLLARGPSNVSKIIHLAKTKLVTLAISQETIRELKIVLAKDKIKQFPNYRSHINAAFVAWYQHNAQLFFISKREKPIKIRDKTDVIYIELAKESKADYLIAGDKDLLSLKRSDDTDIITPKQFIEIYSKNY